MLSRAKVSKKLPFTFTMRDFCNLFIPRWHCTNLAKSKYHGVFKIVEGPSCVLMYEAEKSFLESSTFFLSLRQSNLDYKKLSRQEI